MLPIGKSWRLSKIVLLVLSSVTMVYRILNGLVFTKVDFLSQSSTPSQTRGALFKLRIPHSRTNLYKQNFVASASLVWNDLPASVTQSPSLETFRHRLCQVRLTNWIGCMQLFFFPARCTFWLFAFSLKLYFYPSTSTIRDNEVLILLSELFYPDSSSLKESTG